MGRARVFVDTRRVGDIEGSLRQVFWPARKLGRAVLVGERPWERFGISSPCVLREAEGYRMWYVAWPEVPPAGNSSYLAYAESSDGLDWTRPALGQVQYRGNPDTNLIQVPRHTPTILLDPREPDPMRRYKAVGPVNVRRLKTERELAYPASGYYVATSPDGLVWQEHAEAPILETTEDVGSFIWDAPRRRYLGYVKQMVRCGLLDRRSVAITSSPDFRQWAPLQVALTPDAKDDEMARERDCSHAEFYGLVMDAYDDFLVGLLWMYWPTLPLRPGTRYGWFGQMDVQLIYSYDGHHWLRNPTREPFLSWGERGEFDESRVTIGCPPVHLGSELRFYYTGSAREHAFHHDHAGRDRRDVDWDSRDQWRVFSISCATLPRDRYASISACGVGRFTVDHGLRGGERLLVNARAPNGSVRAEVLDESGRLLPGFDAQACTPFCADSLDAEIRWRERRLSQIPAESRISLRFHLDNADVFAYRTE